MVPTAWISQKIQYKIHRMSIRKTRKQIHFHSKQRWAITIILIAIISILAYGELSTWRHINTAYDHKEHREILSSLKSEKDLYKSKTKQKYQQPKIKAQRFNPNTVSVDELMAMGIKEKDAKSWTKYTSKGGKFFKAEDLKKLYSMNDELYNQLEAYVDIPKTEYKPRQYAKSESRKSKWKDYSNDDNSTKYAANDTVNTEKHLDEKSEERKAYNTQFKAERKKKRSGISEDFVIFINKTDSTELQILDGIGPVLSSRIIKYRDKLGGFHNMNQLLEVYGIKPATISKIIRHLNFDGPLTKIKLNSIEVKDLVKHPYFDYPTANIFINYRTHHGDFKSVEDVKKIRIIKDYWLEEAQPYFDYSPSNSIVDN